MPNLRLTLVGAVMLVPSTEAGKSAGLVSHFSPYKIGTNSEGDYSVFIPWTAFKDDLSLQGAALFGGERPEDDEMND